MNKINQETKKQANSFGLIRFVAAFAIILYHYNKLTGGAHDDAGLPWFSLLGLSYTHGGKLVELFFMISGFCFILFYKDKIEERQIGFVKFITHRYLRLLPSYWLSTCLVFLFTFLSMQIVGSTINGAGGNSRNALSFLLNVLCLNYSNPINGVAWFLAVNIICYVFYYFILTVERRHSIKYLAIICVIGASFFVHFYAGNTLSNIARGLASFGVGGGIALFNNTIVNKKQYQDKVVILSGLCFACVVVSLGVFSCILKYVWWIEVYLLFPSIMIIVTNFRPIRIFFSKKIFSKLGEYSYTIYIFQTAGMASIYMLCNLIGWKNWYSVGNLSLNLFWIFVIGIALDIFYERPIKKHIKNLVGRQK